MPISLKSLAPLLLSAIAVFAQDGQPGDQTLERNLTPDWFWHNRYFALLGMASYGDYDSLCPVQTFTKAAQLKNFPESNLSNWELLETWSTESGCHGFSAIVPEMNKVLMVFRGDYELEQNLPTDTVPFSEFGVDNCEGCTANRFAVQGYNEAKAATNNWEITRNRYYGAGLVFAITGHGLGGMHSLIASVDYHNAEICYYSHTHGTPRTFNLAGARRYNSGFNGEAGERAIWNNDQTSEIIPASADYAHAGTTFYYYSQNQDEVEICWEDTEDPRCAPRPQNNGLTSTQDHYFYFTTVTQCGGSTTPNVGMINGYLSGRPASPGSTTRARPAGSSSAARRPSTPSSAPVRRSSSRSSAAPRSTASLYY